VDGIAGAVFEEEAYERGEGVEEEANDEEVDDEEDDGAAAHLGNGACSEGELRGHTRGRRRFRSASRRKKYIQCRRGRKGRDSGCASAKLPREPYAHSHSLTAVKRRKGASSGQSQVARLKNKGS
jgi:hypothetical protein